MGVGRCDNGSDESIAYPSFAQATVLKGIGQMSAIAPVKIQVTLKDPETLPTFTFSRTFCLPRLVQQMSSVSLECMNITCLVTVDETASEDLLVGLPVLRHLVIDYRMLLQLRWKAFEDTYCSVVTAQQKGTTYARLGRLFIGLLQHDPAPQPSPI